MRPVAVHSPVNRASLGLVLVVLLAGCTSLPGGPTASPAGTLHAQVQNDGPSAVDVSLVVTDEAGAEVARVTDTLPANVGRTVTVPVDEPGRYDVTLTVARATSRAVWLTSDCTDPTLRVAVGENRSVHTAWTCVGE